MRQNVQKKFNGKMSATKKKLYQEVLSESVFFAITKTES